MCIVDRGESKRSARDKKHKSRKQAPKQANRVLGLVAPACPSSLGYHHRPCRPPVSPAVAASFSNENDCFELLEAYRHLQQHLRYRPGPIYTPSSGHTSGRRESLSNTSCISVNSATPPSTSA